MPPITAAVKAIRPAMKPEKYQIVVWYSTKISPAAPASMPPSRKVSEIVVSTLMPMSRAASGSCAVARMALPSRRAC